MSQWCIDHGENRVVKKKKIFFEKEKLYKVEFSFYDFMKINQKLRRFKVGKTTGKTLTLYKNKCSFLCNAYECAYIQRNIIIMFSQIHFFKLHLL